MITILIVSIAALAWPAVTRVPATAQAVTQAQYTAAVVAWRYPVTIMPGVIPLPATGNIAVAAGQDLTALAADGQLVWAEALMPQEQYMSICAGPAGTIYTGGMPGPVQAHAPDGSLLWEYRVPDAKYTIVGCGPDGVAVAVSATRGSGLTETLVHRLDPTGAPLNSFTLPYRIFNLNPVLIDAESVIYLFSFQPATVDLLAVAPDGAVRWTRPVALPACFASSLKPDVRLGLLEDGGVILAAQGVGVHAVNPDGTPRWSFFNPHIPPAEADQAYYSIARGPGNTLLISSGTHVFSVAADGTTLWERGIGQLAGAVVTGGDMIYVQAYRLPVDMKFTNQFLQRLWLNAFGPPQIDFYIAGLTSTGVITNYWQVPDGFTLLQGPGPDEECHGYVATGTGLAAPADFIRLNLPR